MALILVNDGIHPTGAKMLVDAGHEVHLDKIEQIELPNKLPLYDGICVRSATKVPKELIEKCKKMSFIGRGGVGLDNIDVIYAQDNGIKIYNTPSASSRSVAELTIGHLLSVTRNIYKSNRTMPARGSIEFKSLKNEFSKGLEIQGKKLGIIGLGRIGKETAKLAIGMGMKVLAVDHNTQETTIPIKIGNQNIDYRLKTHNLNTVLTNSDFITLHIPYSNKAILSYEEFDKMKEGVIIINASRGGTVDEQALLQALNTGKVQAAGLDVFENEPKPREDLLNHPNVSITPHIGASTVEAQEKIGIELAKQIIDHFNFMKKNVV